MVGIACSYGMHWESFPEAMIDIGCSYAREQIHVLLGTLKCCTFLDHNPYASQVNPYAS